jgi:hypothetical protein
VVVQRNQDAVDAALAEVHRIAVPTAALTERVTAADRVRLARPTSCSG